ncbi:NUDIX domain-containing protein [Colletotrichum truncatum]|uniref:NUDIX domain-containing protein n=1 Tax=Colletotrichum truncatum TaxID=5467 RepID=A0ACC3YTC0_COLTU|nr:NUDIX domain-containing protein [Colletotrichum truncatum]KAF6798330.1 NUDIX domain-containing protein [Colletotrichum truncatum]
MAASTFVTSQYASDVFVESCGAIVFDLSAEPLKVCLLHYLAYNEWLLAKGRRNCGESRHEAALREVLEETGFQCRLLPVDMSTRAPAPDDDANAPDTAATRQGIREPFMLTLRNIDGGAGVKLIWWYVAAVENSHAMGKMAGETQFDAKFFSCDEAIEKLTFENDRDILRKAIVLVKQTLSR